jgi:putative membrane protein
MKKQLLVFIIRWFANAAALWLCADIFNLVSHQQSYISYLMAGLILSLLNVIIKPILVVFTLPAIALSLGLFIIIINGIVVFLTSLIYRPLNIETFWVAVLVGIVVGLVNYIVTIAAEALRRENG